MLDRNNVGLVIFFVLTVKTVMFSLQTKAQYLEVTICQ